MDNPAAGAANPRKVVNVRYHPQQLLHRSMASPTGLELRVYPNVYNDFNLQSESC
jgi:hypothetical protein